VLRENTYTGKLYRDDPTIMSWQLGNEPRGINNREDFLDWIKSSARLIKEIDPNHLVTVGSEGSTAHPSSGNNFIKDHESKYIDYTTIHIWIQNWGWFNPSNDQSLSTSIDKVKTYIYEHEKLAIKLNKPVVLEEFGISRDYNDYSSNSPITLRDSYFNEVFDIIFLKAKNGSPLVGSNFWAWGGFGRPRKPKSIWKKNDEFIGDPPHEFQGWYSIYNSDLSTINIIKNFTSKFNNM
jgi:mannan endo-1,4-beta-mannosidase